MVWRTIALAPLMVVLLRPVVESQSTERMGPLKVHPANKRYFASPSGAPVYLTGSHTWENFQDIGPAGEAPFDYLDYLKVLQAWNHNFIRLWLWEHAWSKGPTGGEAFVSPMPYARPGPELARDGKPRFDVRTFNPEYFARLRERVSQARDRGIYVGILLFISESVKKNHHMDPCWLGHPFHRDNNINGIDGDANGDGWGDETQTLKIPAVTALQQDFIRKVIETVNGFDNVLHEIANECTVGGQANVAWQYDLIRFIRDCESRLPNQHPIGMTGGGPTNEDLFKSSADWISPDRKAPAPYDYIGSPPPADGSKVVLPDTDHLCGAAGYDRGWVWKSFLRGHNPIYMDVLGQKFTLLGNVERNNFLDSKRLPVRRAMGHSRSYASRVDLAAMTPQPELASTGYALANPGKEMLAFQPKYGPFTVQLVAGTYEVEWFNVTDGILIRHDPLTVGDGVRRFSPPFEGEALLYLKRK